MKEIDIGRGLSALVDDADFAWLSSFRWRVGGTKTHRYAARTALIDGAYKQQYMHRLIMGQPRSFVDHIDGNTLNNTRANLRVVTPTENNQNQHVIRSSTGFRGVFAQGGLYIGRIVHNKVPHYVGAFHHPIEAAFHVNRLLDELRPGIGARNKIDKQVLISLLESRKAEIDRQISLVERSEHV